MKVTNKEEKVHKAATIFLYFVLNQHKEKSLLKDPSPAGKLR